MVIKDVQLAFSKGELAQALSQASELIKHNSSSKTLRVLLVELLCYTQQWQRAEQNLIILSRLNPQRQRFYQQWRQNIKAAQHRFAVFNSNQLPTLLHEVTPGIDRALKALQSLKTGRSVELEDVSFASMKVNHKLSGQARDMDELLGGILEVFTQDGMYCWVDMINIQALVLLPSQQQIDQLWCPASLTLLQKSPYEVWLPMIYPSRGEDTCSAGIETKWVIENGIKRGQGLKTWLIGEKALPLNKCQAFIGSRHYS